MKRSSRGSCEKAVLGGTVLVVHRDPAIRAAIACVLRARGLADWGVENALAAAHLLLTQGPFLAVIAEWELPEGSAFTLLGAMRRETIEVPFFILTDRVPPEDQEPPDGAKFLKASPFRPREFASALGAFANPAMGNGNGKKHPRPQRRVASNGRSPKRAPVKT